MAGPLRIVLVWCRCRKTGVCYGEGSAGVSIDSRDSTTFIPTFSVEKAVKELLYTVNTDNEQYFCIKEKKWFCIFIVGFILRIRLKFLCFTQRTSFLQQYMKRFKTVELNDIFSSSFFAKIRLHAHTVSIFVQRIDPLYSTELELLKSLWGLGTKEE